MRRWTIAAALLLAASCSFGAESDSYKQQLIAKYPYYQNATTRFAPLYPALARQILEDYGIRSGVCVDLGGGSGQLAIELARASKLTVYVVDIDPIAVRLCNILADEAGLTGRVRGVEGDAQSMPLKTGFADLIVSRGSIFFWPDKAAGLREAHRVLKRGGVAYIGGGFSRCLAPDTLKQLLGWAEEKRAQNPAGWTEMPSSLVSDARERGIDARLLPSLTPFDWWVEIRK